MPAPTLVVYAHPRPSHSVITRGMKQTLESGDRVQVRSLYELYPDFDIDVTAEQQALVEASLIVWLTPVHWYGVPSLMKHWIDQVLLHGWAYGPDGTALRGKTAWWVCSAGAPTSAYTADGMHMRPFADFVAPIEQTARFCGMHWLPPFVVHGGHSTDAAQRAAQTLELAETFTRHRAEIAARVGVAS
jgi:glutathione-regulated potassium-efflux system ancillary protein KefF